MKEHRPEKAASLAIYTNSAGAIGNLSGWAESSSTQPDMNGAAAGKFRQRQRHNSDSVSPRDGEGDFGFRDRLGFFFTSARLIGATLFFYQCRSCGDVD